MATIQQRNGSSKLICAAIDIGTTFSGTALQFVHDYRQNPRKVNAKNWNNGTNISFKAPTTVLIQPDGKTFEAFGYEAEDKYVELVIKNNGQPKDWYYFSRFKMVLYENMKLKRGMQLEASNGKTLPAIDVYAAAIRYLKEDTMEDCRRQITGRIEDDDVLWVLTVPAIWTDAAKQFMREAGRKAGIKEENLVIALEPEAASIFCKYDSLQKQTKTEVTAFRPGTKYIVLDAGGGTVDVTAHEILSDGNIKELHRPCGGHWGGTTVDRKFNQFLSDVFGPVVFETFCEDAPDDYLTLSRLFEVRKRDVSMANNKPIRMELPCSLAATYKNKTGKDVTDAVKHSKYANKESVSISKYNKLSVESDIMKAFFGEAVTHIVSQVGELLKDNFVKICDTILLVGGFSESPLIQKALGKAFPNVRIINPKDSSLVVLKGAVLFGRQQTIISHRICRFTYGYAVRMSFEDGDPEEYAAFDKLDGKMCRDRFRAIVRRETVLKTTEKHMSSRTSRPASGKSFFDIPFYKSSKVNPRYVTEPDCEKIGTLRMSDLGEGEECLVGGKFGGTEIQIESTHKATGRTVSATFDNLD